MTREKVLARSIPETTEKHRFIMFILRRIVTELHGPLLKA